MALQFYQSWIWIISRYEIWVLSNSTYPLKLNRKYIEANKRVWEHGRDYYRISNEYQQYEHNFDDFGIGASKLTEIALAIRINNLDQWTSQAFQISLNLSKILIIYYLIIIYNNYIIERNLLNRPSFVFPNLWSKASIKTWSHPKSCDENTDW